MGCGPSTCRRSGSTIPTFRIRIGWCATCGMGVTLDPPTQQELSRLYRETYASEALAGQVPRTSRVGHAWHRLNGSLPLTDYPLLPPVLDVGANTGEALLALGARGIPAIGLEPNPRAVSLARAAGVEMIEGPIESTPLPQRHFGSVLLSQVLEHVEEPESVLRTVSDAIRPDGVVYVIVPNVESIWRFVFGPDWVHWHVPFHLYHFTERSLARLASRCGMRVRRFRNVTPGEWLLMSIQARRNARRGCYELESFSGRYGRRILVAPPARLFDVIHRGDAIVAEVVLAR